jgi:hypothetical protein
MRISHASNSMRASRQAASSGKRDLLDHVILFVTMMEKVT